MAWQQLSVWFLFVQTCVLIHRIDSQKLLLFVVTGVCLVIFLRFFFFFFVGGTRECRMYSHRPLVCFGFYSTSFMCSLFDLCA